jgi:hypothetical protein
MHVVYTYFFNYTIKKEAKKTLWCTKVGIVCTRCLCLAIRLLEPSHDALYLELSCMYMRQRISKGCHVHRAVAMCTRAGSSILVKVFCQTVPCTGNQDANLLGPSSTCIITNAGGKKRLRNKFDWIKLITEGLLVLKNTVLNTIINVLQIMKWEKLCQKNSYCWTNY